jgi:hypothetical protein
VSRHDPIPDGRPGRSERWRRGLAIALAALLLGACSLSAAPAEPLATPAVAEATVAPAPPAATPAPSPAAPAATATPARLPLLVEATEIPAIPAVVPPPPAPTATPPAAATPLPAAGLPRRLRIPRLRIDAAVEHVGLAPDGAMDAPKGFDTVGWYRLGTRPGDPGSAVIAGHLDSKTGPAIFWRLRDLRPGDDIFVRGDDGVERRFVVEEAASYRFDQAPLERIFTAADRVRLNLITCGGSFDRRSQNYDQRLVVYATLAG